VQPNNTRHHKAVRSSVQLAEAEPIRGFMSRFDRTDYSVVVKHRASPRWEIYRAGRSSPIKQSMVYFPTMVTAKRAGKEALKQLLDKLFT
jgi:hypothetical protein